MLHYVQALSNSIAGQLKDALSQNEATEFFLSLRNYARQLKWYGITAGENENGREEYKWTISLRFVG